MEPQQIMAYSLVGLLLCNILTLTAIGIGAYFTIKIATDLSKQAKEMLDTVKGQANEILSHVRPVVLNVENSTRNITATVQSATRTVQGVEGSVADFLAPTTITAVVMRVFGIRGMKANLIGIGVGVAASMLRKSPPKKRVSLPAAPSPLAKTKPNTVFEPSPTQTTDKIIPLAVPGKNGHTVAVVTK